MTIYCFLFGTSLLFHVQFCCFLTCIQISQEAGYVVWYSHMFQNFPAFVVVCTVKGSGTVNEAEVYVFLELSCFCFDLGSSAFSKPNLNIWTFSVHVLLKLCLENFEHCFTRVWNECNCVIIWTFFGICLSLCLEWKLTFSSLVATGEFSKFADMLRAAL